jgi:hypothetical protein
MRATMTAAAMATIATVRRRGASFLFLLILDADLAGVTLLVTGAFLVVLSLLWLRYHRIR